MLRKDQRRTTAYVESAKFDKRILARYNWNAGNQTENKKMNLEIPADVLSAINAKVLSGQYPDKESVLREAIASLDEFDENVAELQSSINNWQSGDKGKPIDQAFDLVRKEMNGN